MYSKDPQVEFLAHHTEMSVFPFATKICLKKSVMIKLIHEHEHVNIRCHNLKTNGTVS